LALTVEWKLSYATQDGLLPIRCEKSGLNFRRGQLEFPGHKEEEAIQVEDDLYGERWQVKRLWRLAQKYREEGLMVRTQKRKQVAQARVPLAAGNAAESALVDGFRERSLLRSALFSGADGRRQFTRECVLLPDPSLTAKVSAALDRVRAERGTPEPITVDNGREFASSLMDRWAHLNSIRLNFIRLGKRVENRPGGCNGNCVNGGALRSHPVHDLRF
jgi:hypothetical protein